MLNSEERLEPRSSGVHGLVAVPKTRETPLPPEWRHEPPRVAVPPGPTSSSEPAQYVPALQTGQAPAPKDPTPVPQRIARRPLYGVALVGGVVGALGGLLAAVRALDDPCPAAATTRFDSAPEPVRDFDAHAPSQPLVVPVVAPRRDEQAVLAFLQNWRRLGWRSDATEQTLAGIYHDTVTMMFIDGRYALPRMTLPDRWRTMARARQLVTFSDARPLSIEWDRRPAEQRSASVQRACPAGPLVRVALLASTAQYRCGEGVIVPVQEKEYLLRLAVADSGAMTVCYEAWSDEADTEICRPFRPPRR